VAPKVLAEVDLEQLTAAMKETVERVAANDPAKLKAKVAKLEAELAKKATPPATPKAELKRVEVPALRKGEAERFARAAEKLAKAVAQLVDLGAGVREGLAAIAGASRVEAPRGFTPPKAPARPIAL